MVKNWRAVKAARNRRPRETSRQTLNETPAGPAAMTISPPDASRGHRASANSHVRPSGEHCTSTHSTPKKEAGISTQFTARRNSERMSRASSVTRAPALSLSPPAAPSSSQHRTRAVIQNPFSGRPPIVRSATSSSSPTPMLKENPSKILDTSASFLANEKIRREAVCFPAEMTLFFGFFCLFHHFCFSMHVCQPLTNVQPRLGYRLPSKEGL